MSFANLLTPNYNFAPIIPSHGKGSRLWDTDGKEYIDLAGGIAVNALGHCHPKLIEALTEQAHKLWHISNLYTTEPAQALAQRLINHSFADKVFFCNSGAEANEAALKLARKHAREQHGSQKNIILSAQQSFHGRTLFTVSVGGQPQYSQDFAPLPEGIEHIPYNDIAALEAAINEHTCALILEPIQGESGVLPATHEYLEAARALTKQHQVALIFDEVQTGMGRTGKLFAHQHHNIIPDILTTAKALGAGFPIGAMLTSEHFAASFSAGSHGSTFGGNPLACAVACTAFDLITSPETMRNTQEQSQALMSALTQLGKQYQLFDTIRGQGMLIGCVLSPEQQGQAGAIVTAAREAGVLLLQAGSNVVRLAPALNLSTEERNEAIARLEHAFRHF